jgi:hypothetical protein
LFRITPSKKASLAAEDDGVFFRAISSVILSNLPALMEIYILIENQAKGPYTPELIHEYLKTGQLQPGDLAAYSGSNDWTPLSAMVQSWEKMPANKGTRFTGTTTATRPKISKGKPTFAILATVLVLLAGAGGFAWWKFRPHAGSVVKVSTPLEAGLPNTLAELNAGYAEPPEGQNAATFFLKGAYALQIADADNNATDLPLIGRGPLPPLGGPFPPRITTRVAAFLQKNQTAWETIEKGMNYEQSRYPMDLNKGFNTLLPHLPKVKRVAQIGELTALACADNKQPQAAADALVVSLANAQSLKNEPLLISQLVRVACLAIEKDGVERVLNSVALPQSDLERLSTAFATAESEESVGTGFTHGLVGERVNALTFFDLPPDKLQNELKMMDGTASGGSNAPQSQTPEQLTKNLKPERAFAEETYNRALVIHKEPFPDRLKVNEYFASRADEAKSNEFILCAMLLPALGKQATKEATGLTQLRLAQTAIALEKFRLANGSYPDSLSALAPKFIPTVPADPFDGQPLRYGKVGVGYEMRSVGAEPAKPISFKVVKPPKASAQ